MTSNTARLFDFDQSRWSDWGDERLPKTQQLTTAKNSTIAKKKSTAPTSSVLLAAIDDVWIPNEITAIINRVDVIDDLKKIVRKRLGFRTAHRLKKLASYRKGWGSGDSKALSPGSAGLLSGFLEEFGDFDSRPSLFLTQDGNIELAWEDNSGQAISVTFHGGGCHVERGTMAYNFPITNAEQIQSIARSLSEEKI